LSATQDPPALMTFGSIGIEVVRRGSGAPLLLFPGEEGLETNSAVVEDLAKDHEVIIPFPPGFGRSQRPDWVTNPDDFAYVMLELAQALKLRDAPVVGFSLGGWVAAEMATKDDSFISKLVLVDAYGVKLGGPYDQDIADIWLLHPSKVAALKWRNPDNGKRDYSNWSDEDLSIVARNIESFARFCWEPYMHDPKLKHRLHRISKPTLLLWGENDGVTPVSYGQGYASLIPGAQFRSIPEAGHYPHIEQPQAFLRELRAFID
jgi:pimeloyl-ACP methyl ester carboxylesterase